MSENESIWHEHDLAIDGEVQTTLQHSHLITEKGHTHVLAAGPAWIKERRDV